MGAITLGDKKFAKVEAVSGRYVGDVPQPQAFRMETLKTWIYDDGAETPSGSPSITVPLVVREPKGSKKAKYNGYTIFHRLTLGETSMPFVNAFLDAFGIDRALFHGGKFKTEETQKGTRLVALKGLPSEGSLAGFAALVATKNDVYKGTRKLVVDAMAPYDESTRVTDDDATSEDDDFDDDEDSTTDSDAAADDDDDDDAF